MVVVVCNLGNHSINVVKFVIVVGKHGSKPEFQWLSTGVLNFEGVDAWWNYIPGPDSIMPNMILIYVVNFSLINDNYNFYCPGRVWEHWC